MSATASEGLEFLLPTIGSAGDVHPVIHACGIQRSPLPASLSERSPPILSDSIA